VSRTRELIIESPGLQRPLPRSAWALATALFWFAWFWLWLPLISVIGWALGIYSGFDQFVERWGYIELLRLLPYYIAVIGTTGLMLVGWSLIQYHRFHGKERRKAFPLVTRADIAKSLGLAESTTLPWVDARRMVAHHDENGRVSWVEMTEFAAEQVSKPITETSPVLPTAETPPVAAVAANENEVLPIDVPATNDAKMPLPKRTANLLKLNPGRTVIVPLIVARVDDAAEESGVEMQPSATVFDAPVQLALIQADQDEALTPKKIRCEAIKTDKSTADLILPKAENIGTIEDVGDGSTVIDTVATNGTVKLARPRAKRVKAAKVQGVAVAEESPSKAETDSKSTNQGPKKSTHSPRKRK
jgi:biofilm PGA synthesis protein PgaD